MPTETTKAEPTTRASLELPEKHTFSVTEVAKLAGVNHKTIRAGIDAGKIRAIRIGRVIRIPRSEVLKLLGG